MCHSHRHHTHPLLHTPSAVDSLPPARGRVRERGAFRQLRDTRDQDRYPLHPNPPARRERAGQAGGGGHQPFRQGRGGKGLLRSLESGDALPPRGEPGPELFRRGRGGKGPLKSLESGDALPPRESGAGRAARACGDDTILCMSRLAKLPLTNPLLGIQRPLVSTHQPGGQVE